MSTITFRTAPVLPTRATRLRLTTRGRRVLLSLAALPLAGGIAFAALSGGSALASNEAPAASVTFDTVTVMPGDTLWSIAGEIAPSADPREVIGEITRLNMLPGGVLQVGQELSVPRSFSN